MLVVVAPVAVMAGSGSWVDWEMTDMLGSGLIFSFLPRSVIFDLLVSLC